MGPLLAIRLLALPLDPHKNLSSWWAYFGLTPHYFECICEAGCKFLAPKAPARCRCGAPVKTVVFIDKAPRKKKGYTVFWNKRANALAFLITQSLIKARGYYYQLYRQKKETLAKENPGLTKGHIDARARRYMIKLFIAHYYQAYCELNNIPYQLPYSIDILKHDSLIYWREAIEREKGDA